MVLSLKMKNNHHNNNISLAQCAVLLCALLFAHMAMGGASTSVLTSNNNKGAPDSKSTPSNVEQYYKDVCSLPKSCSVSSSSIMNKDNDNKEIMSSSSHSVCSHDTLHGLSITEHQLRKHVQNNNLHDNLQHTNDDDDVQIGIELQLSHIILEEASVGCALLYMHDTRSRMQANNKDETNENDSMNFVEGMLEQYAHTKVDDIHNGNGSLICPTPKNCQLHAANNDNGEVRQACDMQHFQQIQSSLDALEESSLQDNMSIIRQAELAKLQTELATIGCILMLRRQLNLHSSSSTSTSSSQPQQQQLQIVLSSTLTKYQHSAELFNHLLHQNYVHFTSTPDMKSLVQTLQQIQNKCQKIQYVLTFAGRGEIPDIIWQERVSREKKVEVLTMEEENIRYQLLQLLQHRINDEHIKLSDLNTKDAMHDKDSDDDSKGVWETIADEIERKREERLQMEVEMEAAMQKKEMEQRESRMKMKNVPQLSNQEHFEEEKEEDLAAETSEEECSSSTGGNEGKCTANSSLPPSSQDYILLDRMRKDIELLQQKANEARTDEERYVRLSLVTKMKEQLAQEIGT